MKKTKTSYLLKGTPSHLLVLGAGFVMASSEDLREAIGMGVAVLLAMLLSSIVVSAIHKIIPNYAKIPVYLLIITGFVSLIAMVMEAYFPVVVERLGVHLAAARLHPDAACKFVGLLNEVCSLSVVQTGLAANNNFLIDHNSSP